MFNFFSSESFRSSKFLPKFFLCLQQGYSFAFFKRDLIAGITVGIIALPLAMAFAIASGVGPEKGLYTAIIAGFLISALGGSRVQIGGPTGAFVIVIFDIIQRSGYSGLCVATLFASVILILLGILRIGSWIEHVPAPLITGFTTGIALLIFTVQIKDFLGLQLDLVPPDFLGKWQAYLYALPTLDFLNLSMGIATLGSVFFLRRFFPFLPWGISAILFAMGCCFLFNCPLETIQSRFGEIPGYLPTPTLPEIASLDGKWTQVLLDGFVIAFLAGIESLLSAAIGDRMVGAKHRSNCELIAQGVANFASILFGGIPATGAIARTASNVKSGAKTPIAGMIHAVTLFLILRYLTPFVGHIPMVSLAAVLIMVAWNMSEYKHFMESLKKPFWERGTLLIAFFLTVFVDLITAVFAGMIFHGLSLLWKKYRLQKPDLKED